MANELNRLSTLYKYQILDTPSEEFFDRITGLVSEAFECPVAVISLVDHDRVWFKSRIGIDRTEIPRENSMSARAIENEDVTVYEDLADYPDVRNKIGENDRPFRFYAAAPLRTRDGVVLGTLCALDYIPRTISKPQIEILRQLAALAMAEVEPRAIDVDRVLACELASPSPDVAGSPTIGFPSDVVVGIRNLDGMYEYVSPTSAAVTGYTPDELRAIPPAQLCHPDDLARVHEDAELKIRNGQTCVVTFRGRRKDGVYRWLETMSTPIYDGSGTLINVFSSTRDITAQRLMEQRLVESEQSFRSLYDYSLDAMFSLDLHGCVESVNVAFQSLIGYTAEALRNRSFLDYVDAPDRAILQTIFEMTTQGEPLTFEMTLVGASGKRVPTSGLSVPIVVGGRVTGVYFIARDSSVQKRIETLLREENEVLALIASRVSLESILEEIARSVDSLTDGASAAIILVDRENAVFRCVAAPNLPPRFAQAIATLPLAVTSGSGGAAIHRNERVISDIATDPNWEALRDEALAAGLRTCWSAPILSSHGQPLGAVDIYFDRPRALRPDDIQVVGRVVHLARIAIERDLDDQKLKNSENRFRQMIENGTDVILILDGAGMCTYSSPSVERVLGHKSESIVGGSVFQAVHPDDVGLLRTTFVELLARPGELQRLDVRIKHADGSWRFVEACATNLLDAEAVRGLVINARDVTERRKVEQQLDYMAYHDVLTDMPNRLMFNNRLYRAIEHARRDARHVGVLFLDLDRFKVINDTLGHAIGDLLLRAVAQRILRLIRPQDTVARWGGDEFTMILPDLGRAMEAIRIADKVINGLADPFIVQGHELYITGTIGIAMFPDAGEDVVTLVRNADVAMYRAREQGANYYQVYTSVMTEGASERLAIENELRKALDRKEFMLHFQPLVDAHTSQIVAVEALLRWKHPDRGLIPPIEFISIAEETGQIVPIGEWVLRSACHQAKEWQDAGHKSLRVSVNMSAKQLRHRGLTDSIRAILAETGLAPESLELELTESILIDGKKQSIKALNDLKAMGVHLAIDDFGTGYSSFTYLKSYPVDCLKIDQSFVRNLGSDSGDSAIAQSIIAMAKTLRLSTVAEGVETAEQFEILRDLGCDIMQGYFFSAPLAPALVSRALAKSAKRTPRTTGSPRATSRLRSAPPPRPPRPALTGAAKAS